MQAFGVHLMADCYNCDKEKISDLNLIYNFLDTAPTVISMTKIMPPYVFRYQAKNEEDSGVSGIVLIAESHISAHFFTFKKYISCDVFSCKEFDPNIIKNYLIKTFNVGKIETNIFDRGLEFPKNIWLTRNIIERQRAEL